MATLSSQLILSVLDRTTGPLRAISTQMAAFQTRTRAMMAPLGGMGGKLLALGGGYLAATAGLSGTVGAAIKFESAFADVKKVVDASDEQFQNMSRTIKKMSTELPLTAVEISQLYAAAGESGIALNELKSFSEMAARVGIAFDMSAGQAGDSLAKLKAQLGLNVEETGLMADAINHLSNNMASKASEITEYMLRVGKFAEMGGFHRDQIAAMGSAMIASGADASKAGTAMMNVVRKMTTGGFAKKAQREAAQALGLDLPLLAKQMQKDAPKALKSVLKAIAKAPKDQHVALLSQFFGDEARAFAPLVGNIGLLDQALDSVADRAKYAGSAFKEYVARANTTENALKLLRNRIAYQFEGIGARWLPDIKEAAGAIGDVLDSLGDRVSIFDKLETSFKGFMKGLGYDGSIKSMVADLGDLLFGEIDPAKGADRLGQLFVKMEGWGKSVRELNDAIRDNPIAQFIGEMAGQGFKLMLATMGIGLLAGAVGKLARMMMLLSGASAAIAILKTVAGVGGAVFGGIPGMPGGGGKEEGKKPKPGKPAPSAGSGGFLALLGKMSPWIAALLTSGSSANNSYVDGDAETRARMRDDAQTDAITRNRGYDLSGPRNGRRGYFDAERDRERSLDGYLDGPVLPPTTLPTLTVPAAPSGIFDQFLDGMRRFNGSEAPPPDPLPTLQSILGAVHQPSGTQNVNVTNPTPVHAPINVTVYATTNADAGQIASQVGAKVQAAVQSGFSDGGQGGW